MVRNMCLNVVSKASRRYLQSAAVLVVASMVAGCSSGTQRFTDSFYTGATQTQQHQAVAKEPTYHTMPKTTGAVQSSELPPAQTTYGSSPAQHANNASGVNSSYGASSQPTQVASAGQVKGTPPQNLGTMPSTPSTQTAPSATKKNGSYTVENGDTLYSVSRKTGASVDSIRTANGLTNGGIRVGQSLIIPGGHDTSAASTTQPTKLAAATTTPNNNQALSAPASPAAPAQPAQNAVSTTKPVTSEPAKVTADPAVAKGTDATMKQAEQVAVVAPQATGISKMRWPAQGRILSSFGQKEGSSTNDGIDIMVPEGSSVKAAENGVVIYAGDGLKEFGNTVLIRHEDNIVTVYGHNSKILVQRGQKVRRGDEIAKSGMSGNASTPRVHFEVRKNSSPVNPVKYLEN